MFQIVCEDRIVVIQVKGQFCIIQICIPCHILIISCQRSIPECIQGSNLVSRLDVTVAKVIVGYLTEGIRSHIHHFESLDGPPVITNGIQDRTTVEPVRAGTLLIIVRMAEFIKSLGIGRV